MHNHPFEKLKEIWYQKLADTGFEDAEDTSQSDHPLKNWHSYNFTKNSNKNKYEKMDEKRQYYLQATTLIETYSFENPTHKIIWQYHCDGFSKRKIERLIVNLEPSYKREQIGNIINFIASSII